ncbi:MAG: lipoprotein-releasing ABC transporter permease subunit [Gammaproteobacteria bacterium]
MFRPLGLCIGLRYTRAKRRNHFISFISLTSMLGVSLGVMALITVLSVMNGFERELRSRILGMTAHATVIDRAGPLRDWQALADTVKSHPQVVGAAPYLRAEAMLTHLGNVQGVVVQGILPEVEREVSVIAERMVAGRLAGLAPGRFGTILGVELARTLGADIGDKITLITPQSIATPAGVLPRLKQFTVIGVFEAGTHEYDSALCLVHVADAARLFRIDGFTGIRLRLADQFAAPLVGREIASRIAPRYRVVDWTQEHASFFRALKTEKVVMFVILMLVVAVAAFNIVSTLVMVVNDKAADIAILRTLGFGPAGVMRIFIVQGTVIGFAGTLLGMGGGVWLATHVDAVVRALEGSLHTRFLPPDLYYISELPSDMRWPDVFAITLAAFGTCLVGTLYPAWRAARTQPAEVLRYE